MNAAVPRRATQVKFSDLRIPNKNLNAPLVVVIGNLKATLRVDASGNWPTQAQFNQVVQYVDQLLTICR